MIDLNAVFAGKWAELALVTVVLLVYGGLHSAMVEWVIRHHEHKLVPTLLVATPVGKAVCVLATVPFLGWEPAIVVVGALAIGYVPILIGVGWGWLAKGGGLK